LKNKRNIRKRANQGHYTIRPRFPIHRDLIPAAPFPPMLGQAILAFPPKWVEFQKAMAGGDFLAEGWPAG
jgi:hypothetical protein